MDRSASDNLICAQDFGLDTKKSFGRHVKPRFFAIDFFCGAGGTTRGLIDAGGYVVCGVDKERQPARTYVENNKNATLDKAYPIYANFDIFPRSSCYPDGQQAELSDFLDKTIRSLKHKYPNIPWLFAVCAPCQPFTNLSRKELSAERDRARLRDSRLLEEALNLIKRFKPDVVLSENVAGIRSAKYGNVWHSFEQGLIFDNYRTISDVVCASNFGVPQKRRRSILIGVRLESMAVNSLGALPLKDGTGKRLTVEAALANLPALAAGDSCASVPNHRAAGLSQLNLNRLKLAKPGGSNSSLAETEYGDLRLECHKRTDAKFGKGCFSDAYGRMRPDKPAPTITTKCYSLSNGRFGHFSQDRAISLREAAALQSFGQNYKFYPDDQITPVAKMIGNAVPPKLAEYFSRYAISFVEGNQ
jgi:DNA (cytosine-5)-methyltransferase 1